MSVRAANAHAHKITRTLPPRRRKHTCASILARSQLHAHVLASVYPHARTLPITCARTCTRVNTRSRTTRSSGHLFSHACLHADSLEIGRVSHVGPSNRYPFPWTSGPKTGPFLDRACVSGHVRHGSPAMCSGCKHTSREVKALTEIQILKPVVTGKFIQCTISS